MKWWKQIRTFLTEVRAEMKKVSFPPRREVIQTTIVVLVTSFIFAFFLWIADNVIVRAYEGITKVFGT